MAEASARIRCASKSWPKLLKFRSCDVLRNKGNRLAAGTYCTSVHGERIVR